MLVASHAAAIASHAAHAQTIAYAAVPIIPILLLPFIIVFFVFIFPIWIVSAGVLWLVVMLMRGVASVVHRKVPGALDKPLSIVTRAQRWVWTFGGLAKSWE